MGRTSRMLSRVRNSLWPANHERQLDDELRFHIESRADDLVAQGLSRDRAIRHARLEFGGLEKYKEQYRETRRFRPVEDFFGDLRLAVRSLRRSPALVLTSVLSLALGVAKLSWWAIVLAMAGAFAIVCVIEWLAGREPLMFARPAEPAPVHPIVEAQRAEDTEEQESLGWAAFEEAQEPSDAMTIIGSASEDAEATERPVRAERGPGEGAWGNREVPPTQAEVPQTQTEVPEPEPEPEEAEEEELPEARGPWWRRSKPEDGHRPEPELPRHVRVLPPDDEKPASDPWEEGFDRPVAAEADEVGEPNEETEDDVVEPARRRFRRR